MMVAKYRVYRPGTCSVYCNTAAEVARAIRESMAQNLHGIVYLAGKRRWSIVARFEPWYGVVL